MIFARANFVNVQRVYYFSMDTSVALIIAKTLLPTLRFIRLTEPVVMIAVTSPSAVRSVSSETTLSETIVLIVPGSRFRMLVLMGCRFNHRAPGVVKRADRDGSHGSEPRKRRGEQVWQVQRAVNCRDVNEQLGDNAIGNRCAINIAPLQLGQEVPWVHFARLDEALVTRAILLGGA